MNLIFGDRSLSLVRLLDGDFDETGFNHYELEVIAFVRQWNSNQDQFEVASSGSTGEPKVIKVSRAALKRSAQRTINYLELTNRDIALLCLNIGHIAGLMMLIRSLEASMDVIVLRPGSDPLDGLGEEHQPTFVALVPLQLQVALKKGLIKPPLRNVLVGGAPLDPQLEAGVHQLEINVYHTFGMTETLSHFALRGLNGTDRSDTYHLMPGWEMKQDSEGQLQVREQGEAHWLTTHDLVELVDDEAFVWLGRSDNVVNSGGIKIYPERLESTIYSNMAELGMERRFFCIGTPDSKLGESIVMVVEGEEDTPLKEQIRQKLKDGLPKYHQPRQILFTPHFSETSNGKIRREETWRQLS